MIRSVIAVAGAALITGCGLLPGGGDPAPAGDPGTARASFRNPSGQAVGQATLRQGSVGVLLRLELHGLPPGAHALHIHETGACTPDFQAAGGHYAPRGHSHGVLHPEGKHAGDLPNIVVSGDGTVNVELFAPDVTLTGGDAPLLDGDGSAFIIHENYDDYLTQPTGGGGDRIACAVLSR